MLDHFLLSVVVTRYFPPFTRSQGSQLVDMVNNYYARIAELVPYSGEFSRGAYFADFTDGIQFANFEIFKINFVIETKVGVVYLLARVASQV